MTNPYGLDTLGLWDATAGLPERLRRGIDEILDALRHIALPPDANLTSIAIFGMGTSGWTGDVVAATEVSLPVYVGKSEWVPAHVGPGTLVFAVSWSGETQETLTAARTAVARGAEVIVVSTGGALCDFAREANLAILLLPTDLPSSRSAWGDTVIWLLLTLSHFGLLPDMWDLLTASTRALLRRRDTLIALDGPAEVVARRIGRTTPLIYGSDRLPGLASAHWKQQITTNAKTPAFSSVQPELSHHEIAGWGQNGDVTRQVFSLVTLRSASESPRVAQSVAMVNEAIDEVMADMIEVWAEGDDDLGRLLDLAYFGDFVSLHLAGREGTDPGPTPAVDAIKAAPG